MKSRLALLSLSFGLVSMMTGINLYAQSDQTQLNLEQIMAHPDWIGAPVEQAWWSLDGEQVLYRIKENGGELREIHRVELASGSDETVPLAQWGELDGDNPVYDKNHLRALFIRDGDIYTRHLQTGKLSQITRSTDSERAARFSQDGDSIYFRRGLQWFQYDLLQGLESPVVDLKFSTDPNTEKSDELTQMQLRLFSTLKTQRRDKERQQEQQQERSALDSTQLAPSWYLGDGWEAVSSDLSPTGRWLLLAVQKAGADSGRDGKMPLYVTESGYVDIEDVRTRVGLNPPTPQQLWLLDLEQREKHNISFEELPGINDRPLAFLSQADEETDEEPSPRPLTVREILWQPDGELAAVQLIANDNKDRWLATVDPNSAKLTPRHRLHDEAWINWLFNEYGWLPDGQQLWFLSEESGYSHFYLLDLSKRQAKDLTEGRFEVMEPVITHSGDSAFLLSNRNHPTEYDIFRLDLKAGEMTQVTEMKGVNSFSLAPAEQQLLVRWSSSYIPTQISVVDIANRTTQELTDTRTEEYKAIQWQQPEFVGVPSQHDVEAPIWSKFYAPQGNFEGKRPIAIFVHGAGYTQNTHHKFPYYFREQMFHNLLTQQGYLVLDMDYRASQGYGRDWRTAIYRNMGHPELEDLIDGVSWLVSEHQGDLNRVGVYGGSYGGFMSLMAMFRAPEIFKAGAALRPVTDWAHYNHPYTSRILNTPQDDPEAYRMSSPIEYAENLEGHLLIAHGMLDDNVFYQDSVRLAQRLIELKKKNWELASYPMERHGFTFAESWLDEYRRIYQLFQRTIGDHATPGGH